MKIIDFGFANHLSELKNAQKRAIAGTPNYIAPEIIKNEPPTIKSDTFSIGAILYFLYDIFHSVSVANWPSHLKAWSTRWSSL